MISVLLLSPTFFIVSPHPTATGSVRKMNTVDKGRTPQSEKTAIHRKGKSSSNLESQAKHFDTFSRFVAQYASNIARAIESRGIIITRYKLYCVIILSVVINCRCKYTKNLRFWLYLKSRPFCRINAIKYEIIWLFHQISSFGADVGRSIAHVM